MSPKTFNPNYPVVLGLSGKALTGKTCTADIFATGITGRAVDPAAVAAVHRKYLAWEHLFFALPLKRMAAARTKILGRQAADRVRYELHAILLEVFGVNPLFGAPPYHQLVDMVEQIATLPLEEGKPRTFLQYVGTEICRGYEKNCWVNWMDHKIKELHLAFVRELDREVAAADGVFDGPTTMGVVISDIRFPNEAELVYNHPNGVVVRFSASDRIRQERAVERDNRLMSTEQLTHASEQGVEAIPADWVIDLDTSTLSIAEQALQTQAILFDQIRGLEHA